MTLQDKLNEQLAKGQLDKAIAKAMEAVKTADSELYNRLILFKGQSSSNETDFSKSLISRTEYNQTKARIQNGFQQMLNDFPPAVLQSIVNEVSISGDNKISVQDAESSHIKISHADKPVYEQKSQLMPKELQGYQELLDMVIAKKLALQKDLLNAKESEDKADLKEQIQELEEQLGDLKQKVATDIEKTKNSVTIGNNSSGNFVLQGTSNSSVNLEVNNGLAKMNEQIEKELNEVKGMEEKVEAKPGKILFLAANPTDEARLQTDREYKAIREKLNAGTHRDNFEFLMPELALTIDNLINAMNTKPAIVHFSGHGKQDAIMITNDHNEAFPLPQRALKRLFRQHKDDIKLVVLNSCYSAAQAKVISTLGFYVIGMNTEIADDSALSFATGLYLGFAAGKEIEIAYDDAMIRLEATYPNLAEIPEIWKEGEKLDL